MNWTVFAITAAYSAVMFLAVRAFLEIRHRIRMRAIDREWAWRENCIRANGFDPKTGKRCPSDAEVNRTLDEFDHALADMKADIAKRRAAREQVTQ